MRIKDLFEFGGLKDAKLLAGKGGINNLIESVSVIEVTEPTNGRWFLKNQLSVSALYAIRDDIKAQEKLIKELKGAGASGIVICHIDFWIKEVDERIIRLCDDLDYPLIIVPSDVSYIDIISPINSKLLETYSERYKYALDVQSELIGLIIDNRDIHDIVRYIYSISKSSTAVLDINNRVISSVGIGEDCIGFIEDYCKDNLSEINKRYEQEKEILIDCEDSIFIIRPIISGSDLYGFIVMDSKGEYIAKVNEPKIIIKYACIAMVLMNTKKQRLERMQEIYFRDFLTNLFTWNFENEEMAIKRGKSVNWNIVNKKLLIVININYISNIKEEPSMKYNTAEYIKKYLTPILSKISKKDNKDNLIGCRSDNIIVLLEYDGNIDNMYTRAKKISTEFLENFSGDENISLSVGISNIYEEISKIAIAYKEALDAIAIGRQFSGDNKIYTYLELGYIPLLRSGELLSSGNKIRDHLMDSLIEYDREHNTDLILTLKNLLFSDMNMTEVSNKMFIHRNTLLARKKRIIEILKYNPFEMPYKINYLIQFSSKDNNKN